MSEEKVEAEVATGLVLKDGLSEIADYDKMIEHHQTNLRAIENNIFKEYWEMGGHVAVVAEGATYGDKSVGDMAEKLGQATQRLYEAKRFYDTYSSQEVKDLFIGNKLSWRKALLLTSCQDEDVRKELEDEAVNGAGFDDLKQKVKECNEEKKDIEEYEENNESVTDKKAVADAPDTEVEIARKMKAKLTKVSATAEKLEDFMSEAIDCLQNLDLISHAGTYDTVINCIDYEREQIERMKKVYDQYNKQLSKKV